MELFRTPRTTVRRLTHSDAEAMAEIYGDVEAMRFVGDGRPLTIEICSHWVDVTDRNFEKRGYGMMAATQAETGKLIACVGIVHPGDQAEPEVKYAVRRDWWGQGIATELVKGAVEFGRSKHRLDRMIATVYVDHAVSQGVLRKAGFRKIETRNNDDGSVMEVWEITNTQYPNTSIP
ncbi:MAG TPA: GNAT family N-acetyltransferase [Fimbriimonadaceae bacterium]|nr:GNAT family N-acetyltransferase [Fimbriimonadaceae bacterium]